MLIDIANFLTYEPVIPHPIGVKLASRYPPQITKGAVYRTYADPETRLIELERADVDGQYWKDQVKDPELFLAAYRAQFSDVPYKAGFYKSFMAEYWAMGERRRFHLSLMDLLFQQVKLDQVLVYEPPVKPRDPLGFYGPIDGTDWEGMSKEYYMHSELERRVCVYRNYMLGATSSFMMDPIYDDCLLHYRAMEVRVSEMISIIRDLPETYELVFPGDGIGVGSIASIILERRYVSSEPNRIGALARLMGIITDDQAGGISPKPDQAQVLILSNLSRFANLEEMMHGYRNIIILDASRLLLEGFHPLLLDGTLSTTMYDYRPQTLATQREYQRSYEQMRIPHMTSRDPVVIQSLQLNKKHDPLSEIIAVSSIRDATSGSDFVISERRYAKDAPRRPGSFSFKDGMVNYYDHRTHKVFTEDGYYTVNSKKYQSRTILNSEYDLMGLMTFQISLPFSIWHLEQAYSMGVLVPIELAHMVQDGPEVWHAVFRVTTPNLSNLDAREIDFNRTQDYRQIERVLHRQGVKARIKEHHRQQSAKEKTRDPELSKSLAIVKTSKIRDKEKSAKKRVSQKSRQTRSSRTYVVRPQQEEDPVDFGPANERLRDIL